MQSTSKHRMRFPSLLLSALLLLAALTGCAQAPAPVEMPAPTATQAIAPVETAAPAAAQPPEGEVCFTDMGGNEIRLSAPAKRIVALTPADVEILYAIGAGDALVGCGEYCDYPAEAAALPVVQTGVEINLELALSVEPEVLLLNPQMLATGTVAAAQEQVRRLEQAGITVVISDARDIAGVYEAISMLGVLTGREDGAARVVADMQSAFAALPRVPVGEEKTVYFEISPLEYGLWTAGAGTFMHEIAGMLGLSNCFSDVSGYAAVSEEQALARNPDTIVTVAMYFGEGPTPEEEIALRPGWEHVSAVRDGRILTLGNNELSRPGPRLAEGARLLSAFVSGAAALDDAA